MFLIIVLVLLFSAINFYFGAWSNWRTNRLYSLVAILLIVRIIVGLGDIAYPFSQVYGQYNEFQIIGPSQLLKLCVLLFICVGCDYFPLYFC